MTINQIVDKVKKNNPKADTDLVLLAYDFANKAHSGQTRKSGEPYIQHSLHTAFVLAQMKADLNTIIAGLLHDVPEDTSYTFADVEKNFGIEITNLVRGVTKVGKIRYRGIQRYRENLRKMFLALADDIRIIMIKFSDRLHNLRTIAALPQEKQERIAKESLEIYVPIAELLGIWELKWQMEDICFKILFPDDFKKLQYKYEVEKKAENNQFIHRVRNILSEELRREGVEHEIVGRFKHLYSIFRKMQEKNYAFDEIYDVFALRLILNNISDCYKALGIIHSIWKPKAGRFKDYIALPKPNGYRSLHTTVFGPEGKSVEFQIRTEEMNDEALYGIAAHWYYKMKYEKEDRQQPKWVEEILEIQRQIKNTEDFIKNIKLDVFQHRIFVLSPEGDAFELPEGATPIDFAYAVHTDIGDKAVGAKINEEHAPLDTELKNGDVVEILVEKNRKGPSYDWLDFVKSKRAKEKIKQNAQRHSFFGKFMPKFKEKEKG
ncbi:MAG TPA: RelA/SpoT family protein [Candidatus Methylomirabilis sp.]|nr:RelA/SpoT family protein [Candidatus Methylomirabilis sp.]